MRAAQKSEDAGLKFDGYGGQDANREIGVPRKGVPADRLGFVGGDLD